MPQLAFAGCLSLLELFQGKKVMCHTTINYNSKLGIIQTDWYNQ